MRGLLTALLVLGCGDDSTPAHGDASGHDAPTIDAPMADAAPPDASCASIAWVIEDLEPMADSPSMVMDAQGGMHVAFVNGRFTGPLFYGHRPPGGSWSHEMASADTATDSTGIAVD